MIKIKHFYIFESNYSKDLSEIESFLNCYITKNNYKIIDISYTENPYEKTNCFITYEVNANE